MDTIMGLKIVKLSFAFGAHDGILDVIVTVMYVYIHRRLHLAPPPHTYDYLPSTLMQR